MLKAVVLLLLDTYTLVPGMTMKVLKGAAISYAEGSSTFTIRYPHISTRDDNESLEGSCNFIY